MREKQNSQTVIISRLTQAAFYELRYAPIICFNIIVYAVGWYLFLVRNNCETDEENATWFWKK